MGRPRSRVKKICKTCGKEFEVPLSVIKYGGGKYCSQKCFYISREGKHNYADTKKVKRICKFCGKSFYTYSSPSTIKRGMGKFCSRLCQGKWRTENLKGVNHPCWRRKKRECLVCGKTFYVIPSRVKDGGGKFCSNKCYSLYRVGEKASNWRGGKVERVCAVCNKKFKVDPNVVRRNHGRFCSRSCQAIWGKKHSKTKNTSIELKVEDMLKNLGIKYEAQKVIPEGKTIADFYIPEQRLVLYADGLYWHSLPENKKRDINHDFLLGFRGYKVLRLREEDINKFPKKCIREIRKEYSK